MGDFRSQLPTALYTAAQCRELDRLAAAEYNLPATVLMKRAGRAAYHYLLQQWREPSMITVFCGVGNNGGDGFILAGLAAEQRQPVRIVQVGDLTKLSNTARRARDYALQAQASVLTLEEFAKTGASAGGVIVDALLGIGLGGEVREPYREAIKAINAQVEPVLAIDIPSGLCADTGRVLGCCVRASATITFIGLKRGLLTGAAPGHTGCIHFEPLDLPPELMARMPPDGQRLELASLMKALPARPRDSHKGHFGHVLILGGDHGMGGAVMMAAEAAARVGAGLISVGTRAEHLGPILSRRPELMPKAIESPADLTPLLERANALVIGPGLGTSEWSRQLLAQALATDLPVVVDADALNLISAAASELSLSAQRGNWVLTPHPGEAGRLLGCEIAEVQADRFAAVRALQARFGGVSLLKGAGTLIAAESGSWSLAAVGNPGMASGGMGDVLSGVIGGLLAQGLTPTVAAQLGALLHGCAADRVAIASGERGMLATDLFSPLQQLVNGREC